MTNETLRELREQLAAVQQQALRFQLEEAQAVINQYRAEAEWSRCLWLAGCNATDPFGDALKRWPDRGYGEDLSGVPGSGEAETAYGDARKALEDLDRGRP